MYIKTCVVWYLFIYFPKKNKSTKKQTKSPKIEEKKGMTK